MPVDKDIKKVLIIGSGPIQIGQAAEFDYSGSQACKSLREEGIETVLVNSNPATIQTDIDMADTVYTEPLTPEVVARIIEEEQVDSILPTMGGQTGLNIATGLGDLGLLDGIKVLGSDVQTIKDVEDRDLFANLMDEIGEEIPKCHAVESVEEALEAVEDIGYPVIVRPAFTLGGTGGGIAHNEEELIEIATHGLDMSFINQVLIDESVLGWKEIEFEVMRDKEDTCIIVCTMENIDPMGIHTGDSVVVAPIQNLCDETVQKMRDASIKIIRALGIRGGCNIQFALNPETDEYKVIEVNPRVSRSSALASKATGYPIAKISSKIALGLTLDEIKNDITKETPASFEPAIDYVVIKIPRWPFDKFKGVSREVGVQMKATGEVMAIGRTFEEAFQKALRSLDMGFDGFEYIDYTEEELSNPTDKIYFQIYSAIKDGMDIDKIRELTNIDNFFLYKIRNIVNFENSVTAEKLEDEEFLRKAKQMGCSNKRLADLSGQTEEYIKNLLSRFNIKQSYKMVDTCAAEFAATTPYYYSVYGGENEAICTEGKKKVLVLGSGPIRIGQGIEFDFCSVHCTWAFSKEGYETIIVNNNPETVSTDFDIADKLYFEPLTPEDVENIVNIEKPDGAVVQFGGQTAIKLTEALMKMGVPILGTSAENVDAAEDRELFDAILEKCEIPRPKGQTVFTAEEAKKAANELGYPVLVRPSYVLGGQGMQIAINDEDVEQYIGIINRIAQEHPILVDKYLVGKEIEVDAVCDGEDIVIPGIMEHIERAGIHSGDSISVYPAQTISQTAKNTIEEYTRRLARALHVVGMINIQFIVCGEEVYVIEVNPRSSRTVPYISKVTGIPIVPLAAKVIMGYKLKDMGYTPGLQPEAKYFAIKMPVFSFEKIRGADISLGPEMKSTGECLGIAESFNEALYKAFLGAGINLPKHKNMIMTVRDEDKPEAVEIAKRFEALGYRIYATRNTAKALKEAGVKAIRTNKIEQPSPNLMDLILGHKIDLVIDTPSQGVEHSKDGFLIRRNAIETGVNVLTAMDTARALVTSLENTDKNKLTLINIAEI